MREIVRAESDKFAHYESVIPPAAFIVTPLPLVFTQMCVFNYEKNLLR